jgi:hypothetical protein
MSDQINRKSALVKTAQVKTQTAPHVHRIPR